MPIPVFVIFRQVRNARGFVDTTILEAVHTKRHAEERIRQLEDDALAKSQRVDGREGEWPDILAGKGRLRGWWSIRYGCTETPLAESSEIERPADERRRKLATDEIIVMVRIIDTYLREGVTDFGTVVRQLQQDLGPDARKFDRAIELAWKFRRKEVRRVVDVLAAAHASGRRPVRR
jgi:hypothetical protein